MPLEPTELPPDAPYWLIDGIPAYLVGPQERPQPGESGTYELVEMEYEEGLETTWARDNEQRYRMLRDRAKHSQTIALDVTIRDKPIYSVPNIGFDPLVSVEPGLYDDFGTPIWGLVTAVSDSTMNASRYAEFSMDVAYLADRDAYPDKAAVRAAHEREGF